MARRLETERFFEEIAPFYEKGKRWVRDESVTKLIVEWMAVWDGCQLLSVGMGTGRVEADLKEACPGLILHGIDVSSAMIRQAKAKEPLSGSSLLMGLGEELPYSPESFDRVYLRNVLYHVDRPEKLFLEAKRVLRVGGDLLVVQTVAKTVGHKDFLDRICAWVEPHQRPFLTGLEFIAFMRRVLDLEELIAFGIDVGSFVGRDYLDPLGASNETRERVIKAYRRAYRSMAKTNLREKMHLKPWGDDVFSCQHFILYLAAKTDASRT